MINWESVFINGIGSGLLGANITNWDMGYYSLPAFILVVLWGVYLEKINDLKEVE